MHDLKQRLVMSVIWIILLVVLVYLSPYSVFPLLFTAGLAFVIGIALWEYYRMAQHKGFQPMVAIGLVGGVCYVFASFLQTLDSNWDFVPICILGAILFALFIFYFYKAQEPFLNIAITFFGIIYITTTLSLIININFYFPKSSIQDGRWWILYLLAVTKFADIGGYFIGKAFGKHKLALNISPGKTIEGFIGGICLSLLASLFLCFLDPYFDYPLNIYWTQAIFLGILLGVVAQLGDLAESLLKRDAGVKDSNNMKGHGGVLDMVDSLLFTAPVIYTFLKIRMA